ncbi:hypothetical protein ET495_03850 [Xylanimonas allomyrinae]|uniref:Uncharacterized protein n=1 Tax=Xylanimonas allomyrinae TaxID=2509459 RepID=A0A4P6EML9_9MICO|nr:hypothetical protein [Xylanimonas allomyrinae]QAY62529.1 hypothetical protein ET495_03850 [Xylanimonas allomyrinae]
MPWLLRHRPVLARDLVGQARRPVTTLVAVAAGVLGGFSSLAFPSSAGRVSGALLLFAATGGLARGLVAFLRQPAPGGLLPGRGRRVLAEHAAVPLAGTGLALGVAGVVAAALGAGAPGWGGVVGLGLLVVAARAWVASTPTVPAALYAPIVTPMGDLSQVVVGAYVVRGWLVVAGVAWAAGDGSPVRQRAVVVAAVVVMGALAAERAERV